MKKEDNLITSHTLSEFYKTALDKGWLPKEELTKNASAETSRYAPSGNLIQDLVNLAFGLREIGLYSQAESLESKINIFKKAQYEMHNLIDQNSMALQQHAHPESTKVVDAQNGWGVVHTNIDRQRKILETLTHQPKGVHQESIKTITLAAADALGLLKFAQGIYDPAEVEAETSALSRKPSEAVLEDELEEETALPSGKFMTPEMKKKVVANKKATANAKEQISSSIATIEKELGKIKSGRIFNKENILKNPESPLSQIYFQANSIDSEEFKKIYRLFRSFGDNPDNAENAIANMGYNDLYELISGSFPALTRLVKGSDYQIPIASSSTSIKVTTKKKPFIDTDAFLSNIGEGEITGGRQKVFNIGESEEMEKAKSFTQDQIMIQISKKSASKTHYIQNTNSIWVGTMYINEGGVSLDSNSLRQKESVRADLAKSIASEISEKISTYFSPAAQQAAGSAIFANYESVISALRKIKLNISSDSLYEDRKQMFKEILNKSSAVINILSKDKMFTSFAPGANILGQMPFISGSATQALVIFKENPVSTEIEYEKISSKQIAPVISSLESALNDLIDFEKYWGRVARNGPDHRKMINYYKTLSSIREALRSGGNLSWTELNAAIAKKSGLQFDDYTHLVDWVGRTAKILANERASSPALGPKESNFKKNEVVKLGKEKSDVDSVVLGVGQTASQLANRVQEDVSNLLLGSNRSGGAAPAAPAGSAATPAAGAPPKPPTPATTKSPTVPGMPTDSGGGTGTSGARSGGGGAKSKDKLDHLGKAVWDMQTALNEFGTKLAAAQNAEPKANDTDTKALKIVVDGAWGSQTQTAVETARKWVKTLKNKTPTKGTEEEAEFNTTAINEYLRDQGWAAGTRPGVELDRISAMMLSKSPESESFPNSIPLKDTHLDNLSTFYNFIIKKLGQSEEQLLEWWINIFNWFLLRVEYLRNQGKLGDPSNISFYKNRINYLRDRFYSIITSPAYDVDLDDEANKKRLVSSNLFMSDAGRGAGGAGSIGGGGAGGAVPGERGAGGDTSYRGLTPGAESDAPPFDENGINLASQYFQDSSVVAEFPDISYIYLNYLKQRAITVARLLFAAKHQPQATSNDNLTFLCAGSYLQFLQSLTGAVSAAWNNYNNKSNATIELKSKAYDTATAYLQYISSHQTQIQQIIEQMIRLGKTK